MTCAERLWARVEPQSDGCWVWQGAKNSDGYGVIRTDAPGHPLEYTHRVSYQVSIGPIKAGLTIDHLCCRRDCANPAHFEQVTREENTRRRNVRRARERREMRQWDQHLASIRHTERGKK